MRGRLIADTDRLTFGAQVGRLALNRRRCSMRDRRRASMRTGVGESILAGSLRADTKENRGYKLVLGSFAPRLIKLIAS